MHVCLGFVDFNFPILSFFPFYLEQIEKRRAEVNEEMAEIVNRFEAATESLQLFNDTHNNSTQNTLLLQQSSIDNHMDQSEDDGCGNKRSNSSNHGKEHDESSNDDADTNDDDRLNRNGKFK